MPTIVVRQEYPSWVLFFVCFFAADKETHRNGKEVWKLRKKMYKGCLWTALRLTVFTLCLLWLLQVYRKIPDNIKIRKGEKQVIDIGVPVEGIIRKTGNDAQSYGDREEGLPAAGGRESNIPADSIWIDLQNPVTVKADREESYYMDLKLFGIIPFKQVSVQVIEDKMLTPVGLPIGIYLKTEGVMVIGIGDFKTAEGTAVSPAAFLLKTGDYILSADGETVTDKKQFVSLVENSGGNKMTLTVKRKEEVMDITVTPQKNAAGEYKIGIWVRDNAQGIGTMTFVDGDGNFGALGHSISDVDAGITMDLKSGTLYDTKIIAVRKGEKGSPGEMTGMIEYSDRNILGEITENSNQGIYGICNEKMLEKVSGEPLKIALRQEVKVGKAKILCTIGSETAYYDIEIKEMRRDADHKNKEILLEVTDPALIEKTGGIVQGMSGAPIIQNGKLVGAVTHVLVNDPTSGYGIFIENMLEH